MPYGIAQCYLPPGRGDVPAVCVREPSDMCAVGCRLMFYVDQGDQSSSSQFHGPGIAAAFMDGSVQRFIDRGGGLLAPQRLTVDRVGRRVYFTDPQLNAVFQLDYDGRRRFTLHRVIIIIIINRFV